MLECLKRLKYRKHRVAPIDENEEKLSKPADDKQSKPTDKSSKPTDKPATTFKPEPQQQIPPKPNWFKTTFIWIMDKLTAEGSTAKIIRTVLVFIATMYNVIVLPLRVCFLEGSFSELWWEIIDRPTDLLFWIDIFIRFFEPYELGMELITEYKKTAKHYVLSKYFWLDLLATFPFDLFSFIDRENFWLALLRLNRLLRLYRMSYYFGIFEKFVTKRGNPSIIRLFRFVFFVVLICHWCTCVWYFIITMEGDVSYALTLTKGLYEENAPLYYKYGVGMYWVIVSMTGGGTQPLTDLQAIFCIGMVLLGVTIYSAVLGTVTSLVQNMDTSTSAFKQKMDAINDYMKYRGLSNELKARVRTYYTYVWSSKKGLDEGTILKGLPDYLRKEVAMYLNRDLIQRVPLFRNVKDSNFFTEVVMKLKPKCCLPGSYIIRAGEIGREMFFLVKGKVEVVVNGKVVATLNEGSFFGEIALIKGVPRNASIRAKEYCDLYVFFKEDFDKAMKNFPAEARAIYRAAKEREQQSAPKPKTEEKKSEEKQEGEEIKKEDAKESSVSVKPVADSKIEAEKEKEQKTDAKEVEKQQVKSKESKEPKPKEKKEETKPEEKKEELKKEETKPEQKKEESKPEEKKVEEQKVEEPKQEKKKEEPKVEESKKEAAKPEGKEKTKVEEPKKEEEKIEEKKEAKVEEPKKEEEKMVKKSEETKVEVQKEETKPVKTKLEEKKEATVEEHKKEETKPEEKEKTKVEVPKKEEKTEEKKPEETKVEEHKKEETKPVETKLEEKKEATVEEHKKEETKPEEKKEIKVEESKKEEDKAEKREDPKKEEKVEEKNPEEKIPEEKKEESKPDDKKEEPKPEEEKA